MTSIEFNAKQQSSIMDVLLDQYKKTYVMQKMYQTPEYNTMMERATKNIEQEFSAIDRTYNELLNEVTFQQDKVQKNDSLIHRLDKTRTKLEKDDILIKGESYASKPRYNDSYTHYTYDLVTISIQILSIIGVSYLFFKYYKTSNVSLVGSSEKKLPQLPDALKEKVAPVGL